MYGSPPGNRLISLESELWATSAVYAAYFMICEEMCTWRERATVAYHKSMAMLVILYGLLNMLWKTQSSSGWSNPNYGVSLTINGSELKHPVGLGQYGWSSFLRTAKTSVETAGQQFSWTPGVRHNFFPRFWKAETFQSLKGCCKSTYLHASLVLAIPVEQVSCFLPSGCLEEWCVWNA